MNGTEEKNEVVEILWTGGFDSTFRIVQLSQREIVIQPIYLDSQRKSRLYELEAIDKITQKLKEHEMTRCTFAPLIIIEENQRKKDFVISVAYDSILEYDFLGPQYKWLGSFALKHPGIELSVHEDDRAINVIKKYGQLIWIEDGTMGGITNWTVLILGTQFADYSRIFIFHWQTIQNCR
ncbi:MAG: hypothetical protein K1W08_06005 [Lachnospiraceae bacterium]